MPPLSKPKRDFQSSLNDARNLFVFCSSPVGIHTDPGIEAALLQLFKAWESFLEDCVCSYLSGRLSCDGKTVATYIKAPNERWAAGMLYGDRAYLEWTDPEAVLKRVNILFQDGNRISSTLSSGLTELRQLKTIRNAIAHSSPTSVAGFAKLVTNLLGSSHPTVQRPAQLLVRPVTRSTATTYFEHYAQILDTLAVNITG